MMAASDAQGYTTAVAGEEITASPMAAGMASPVLTGGGKAKGRRGRAARAYGEGRRRGRGGRGGRGGRARASERATSVMRRASSVEAQSRARVTGGEIHGPEPPDADAGALGTSVVGTRRPSRGAVGRCGREAADTPQG